MSAPGDLTVWDCIRLLNRRNLSVKHKGRSIDADEGLWLVGRRYGRFFAITESFGTLEALGAYVAGLEAEVPA